MQKIFDFGQESCAERSLLLQGHLQEVPGGGFLHPRENDDC
jgi:hypothetical protein